jgi:alpha-tubulin suppressor-like RCC1 family protein
MRLLACGSNSHGQLSLLTQSTAAEEEDVHIPQECYIPPGIPGIKKIAAGANHTVLLSTDGRAFVCGSNEHGQISPLPSVRQLSQFTPLPLPFQCTDVACGWNHTLLVSAIDGQVYGLGDNQYRQLANCGRQSSDKQWQPIDGLSDIVKVCAGVRHSLASDSKGQCWGWGWNRHGQLGGNLQTDIVDGGPRRIGEGSVAVTDMAAGFMHTAIQRADGSVKCFGSNRHGQLIDDEIITINNNCKKVICGWHYTLILLCDGQLKYYGKHDTELSRSCQQLKSVCRIATGSEHLIAITDDGNCHGLGWNEHGNCGVMNDNLCCLPAPLTQSNAVKDVYCGYAFTFFLYE